MIKKPYIIHPFLFALFPVLFLYAYNLEEALPLKVIVLPAIVTTLLVFPLLFCLGFAVKDKRKAGVIVSFLLLIIFSYGHVSGFIRNDLAVCGYISCNDRYFMWYCLLSFAAGVYLVLRLRSDMRIITNVLNIISASLIIISIINIGAFNIAIAKYHQYDSSAKTSITDAVEPATAGSLRDIYYIILDRYTNADILKEIYGYDNTEFINGLTAKGFYVASQSRSNYMSTAPSLASSLNMEYINYLSDEIGTSSKDRSMIFSMMQDYKVWRFLKSKGYRFIHMGDYYQQTVSNQYADLNINYFKLSRFNKLLFDNTILYPFTVKFGIYDERKEHWERTLYKLEKLKDIPRMNEPTFVFAHMLVPHTPFVFDRNGNFLQEEIVESRTRNNNYLEQLIFINRKIEEVIDSILSAPGKAPIIIIQADEGSYPTRYVREEKKYDVKKATTMEIRQKLSILNAYFLPGVDNKILYPSITPVNSFRIVFNLYFNAGLELLSDESYLNDMDYPYMFYNVTDRFNRN